MKIEGLILSRQAVLWKGLSTAVMLSVASLRSLPASSGPAVIKTLSLDEAVRLIKSSAVPILEAYAAANNNPSHQLLYRGENGVREPSLLLSPPDLLDPGIVGLAEGATKYP